MQFSVTFSVLARGLALATVAACLLVTSPAFACLELPTNPPRVTVTGDACDGPLEVRIHDYSTFAASGDFCGCALNIPLTQGQVLSATIVEAGTSNPISAFGFSADPDVTFNPAGDWQGFQAAVASVVGGIEVDLVFQVAAHREKGCEDGAEIVAAALRDPANGFTVGTGGTDSIGTPNHHVGVTPVADVDVKPINPDRCEASRALPCAVDLVTGEMSESCFTSQHFGLAGPLKDTNGDEWLEGVFRVRLEDGCNRVCAVLDYTERPTGFTFNLGDSFTNNGFGGNDGGPEQEAEVQILRETMTIYSRAFGAGATDRPVVQGLALNDSSYKVCVSDQRVTFGQPSGSSITPFGEELFFLPDPGGDGNNVFIGLNRVIKTLGGDPSPASRVGTGLRRAYISVD